MGWLAILHKLLSTPKNEKMKLKASAAILAGGENKRNKGFPKIFEKINGERLIDIQLKAFEKIFNDIMIVATDNLQFSSNCPHRIIQDIYSGRGPLGGIHSALQHAKHNNVFILAGDMPYPNIEIIESMAIKIAEENVEALIPIHVKGREPLYAFYNKSAILPIENCLQNNPKPRIICVLDYVKYSEIPFDPIPKCFENINTFR